MRRRSFLAGTLAFAGALLARAVPALGSGTLTDAQRRTLDAALARMIPADSPTDWSAADAGAGDYIQNLLAATNVYAGGPTRAQFPFFQTLSRIKAIGWNSETVRLRRLYADGLAQLDSLAGGDYASAPGPVQVAVLQALDDQGSEFFAALYNHTMEGVYGHPVYGGNRGYAAWRSFGYAGDVHGVRFPDTPGPWHDYGGYAPEEMIQPG